MAFLFQDLAAGKALTGIGSVGFLRKSPSFKPADRDSQTWFRNKAMGIQSVNTQRLIKNAKARTITHVTPSNLGQMVMFFYDPKHKETLPFYDKFPLVFIIEAYKDGFLGLNLHYLPPQWRAKLMNALYETINNQKYDQTTKLRLTYKLLGSTSKMRMFAPCVKRYLYSHVRSNMAVVEASEWDYAAFLPLARFSKASRDTVYRDSVSKF